MWLKCELGPSTITRASTQIECTATTHTPMPAQVAEQVAAASAHAGVWMLQQRRHQRYELALCIPMGAMVWWGGPARC